MQRPVRIANASGFYGDRQSALAEMVTGGDVDVVTGDYLAEVTMLVLAKSRLKNPGAGYAATFPAQLAPVLGTILERDIKVVVNAGGLNPRGLADLVAAKAAGLGLAPRIACVLGDDLMPRLGDLRERGLLTGGEAGPGFEPLTANAYLGGWGIARALEEGADLVICGRVTDAALTVGPAAWWHGWARDDWDRLAGAVAAGHVIECGAQATGGNYASFTEIANMLHPGFPIAEVAADGSSVITKHEGTGGAVTVGTVTAQLVYEIQGTRYLNPDVTTLLDTIELTQDGPDRVRVSGTRGAPPPATAKVAVTGLGGYENETTLVLTGRRLEEKAALVERSVRAALGGAEGVTELAFQRIGTAADDPADQGAASALLRIAVRGTDEKRVGRAFSGLIVGQALSGYPGFYATGTPSGARSYGRYVPALVPVTEVEHRVQHADGSVETIAPPPVTADAPDEPVAAVPSPPAPGSRTAPLGEFADARSGDKGGDANLGVWVRDAAHWEWLRATLTTDRLRELLTEAAGLRVDRYELPRLHALNFVVRGLLGDGATSTVRFDAQAKALGEYVLARHVAVPSHPKEQA
ncbi:DUF1446 domain-containing protein [Actinomadura viridis]|uniref:DUF1446 domain-containing protein n=1 Tax=Actinomadura viridis TaxID=58110 RepID=A0A931DS57_9ACTN|nr:acyclic terpene utilization AtuA family protein [Actinomadura viridis]MBG6092967.1 hypothetical protein [Actinomadura viridis]